MPTAESEIVHPGGAALLVPLKVAAGVTGSSKLALAMEREAAFAPDFRKQPRS